MFYLVHLRGISLLSLVILRQSVSRLLSKEVKSNVKILRCSDPRNTAPSEIQKLCQNVIILNHLFNHTNPGLVSDAVGV